MSPPEQSPDLDPRVASAIDQAVARLRDELMGQLADTRRQLEGMAAKGEPEFPLEPSQPETLVDEAVPPGAQERLLRGISRIDRARSQAGLLAALLAATEGFASRAAIFLTRAREGRGWGGIGFGEAQTDLSELEIDYSAEASWAELADGLGCVRLGAGECSVVCRGIDAPLPKDGVLVPLILRDQVAAVLYADRLTAQDPLQVPALQVLTFATALAIETLPLRDRDLTPTLRMTEDAGAEEEGLSLWGAAPAVAATAAEALEEVEPEEPVVEAEAEPEAFAEAPEEAVIMQPEAPAALEPEAEEPAATVVEAAPEPEAFDVILEDEPLAAPEAASEEALEVETAFDETLSEPSAPPMPEGVEPELQPADEVGFQVEVPRAEFEAPSAQPVEAPEAELEAEPVAPIEAVEAELEEQRAEPVEAPPSESVEAPEAEAQELETAVDPELGVEPDIGAEVAPPDDLAGPGWAFSGAEAEADESEEAAHEEAKRLARLLVTEIKLYNEEQVEQGRKNGDLMKRLEEDIERSRQIYDERVDDEIRGKTDYFGDELVRILADGDADAL